MVIYGVDDTMKALEAGSLETVMLYENANYYRMQLKNKDTDSIKVVYCKEEDKKNPKFFKDGIHDMELVECVHLNEWVTEHYTDFKTNLEFITDKSPEGF